MTGNRSQSLDRLAELLDIHGGNTTRWPKDERAAFETLIKQDARARTMVEQAAGLDDLLAASPAPPVPAGAVERLLARANAPAKAGSGQAWRRFAGWLAPFQGALMPGSLLAASLMLGIALGAGGYLDAVIPPGGVVTADLNGGDELAPVDGVLPVDFTEEL
jgi:anti-sigma factor RsiW